MIKILVIEDNSEMRENISEILELSNYSVVSAKDGMEGVKSAREHKPDLILCDIMMPNLDGFGVLKIIRQEEALKTIPFIFLTAKAEKEDFRKGMNLGAEDYLIKPFEATDLLDVIAGKLDKFQNLIKFRGGRLLGGMIDFNLLQDQPKVNEILGNHKIKELGKKTKLWTKHERVNSLYFLEKGLVKESLESVGGKELILNFYEGPCFIGINHLFQMNYSTAAEIIETSSVKTINKTEIEDIIQKDNLWASFYHYCHQKFAEQNIRLSINSYGNVREKVAYHLYYLHHLFQNKPIPLSREDLASFCGIAKETLIRSLTEFKEEKILEISQSGIIIKQASILANAFS